MKELGFELKRLVVNRIGNVSFSVDNSNNLQFEDQYVITVAPYLHKEQYIAELFVLLCLLTTAISSPYLLNLILLIMSILPIIHFFAVLSTLYVIKTAKTSAFSLLFPKGLLVLVT
ncbi:MAG: hypothetical protein ACP6IS_00390 [Candidatus Asgardarchaeia archaeon]